MFHGSMVALVTPMKESGEVDFVALEGLVEMHIAANTQGLVTVGTTGEASTLTPQEQSRVVKHVVEQAQNRVPVVAGTASNSTSTCISLAKEAMASGADGCLIMTPAYIKPTQEGLYQHYTAIAKAVGIPIILYNVPSRTACDLLPETVFKLSKIPNIVGLKEATGSLNRIVELLDLCGGKIDLYSGNDSTAMHEILLGAKGTISVTANVAPVLMSQMCERALAGDKEGAKAINDTLLGLHKNLFVESNPIPVKWALARLGKIQNVLRLPLTPLSKDAEPFVLQAMNQAGV